MVDEQRNSGEITVASERIYSGRVVGLRVDTVVLPNGRHYKREIVEHRGAVVIVALDGDENVLMVRQYRKAIGEKLLELPAGTLEVGEDPQRCAARELEEETGFCARNWELLTAFYSSPGFCNEVLHLFLASELTPGRAANEPDEQIEVVRLPLREAFQGIGANGGVRDAKSIVGLLMARERTAREQR